VAALRLQVLCSVLALWVGGEPGACMCVGYPGARETSTQFSRFAPPLYSSPKSQTPEFKLFFILVQERRRRRRRRPNRFEPTTSPLVRTPPCRRRGGWWIFRRCRADITSYVLSKEASQSTELKMTTNTGSQQPPLPPSPSPARLLLETNPDTPPRPMIPTVGADNLDKAT
jgi:hypothetical protein